jgi:hypothetical protein
MLWDNRTDRCTSYAASQYVMTVQADNPVLYYRLGETAGSTAINSAIPNANPSMNGTYNGGYILNQAGAVASDPDGAVLLDGATAYVRTPNTQSLSITSALSLEAWVRWTSTATSAEDVINKWRRRIAGGHRVPLGLRP